MVTLLCDKCKQWMLSRCKSASHDVFYFNNSHSFYFILQSFFDIIDEIIKLVLKSFSCLPVDSIRIGRGVGLWGLIFKRLGSWIIVVRDSGTAICDGIHEKGEWIFDILSSSHCPTPHHMLSMFLLLFRSCCLSCHVSHVLWALWFCCFSVNSLSTTDRGLLIPN